MTASWLLAFATLLPQGGAGDTARAVVHHAQAAVEGDSVAVVERRWRREAGVVRSARAALLGLATLAQLTYQPARAESLYVSLIRARDDDAIARESRVGQAHSRVALGDLQAGDSLFALAANRARAAGDSSREAEALLSGSLTRLRVADAVRALRLVDLADSVLPARDDEGEVQARCTRAWIDATRSVASARLAADSGAADAHRLGFRRMEAFCNHVVASVIDQLGYTDSARQHLRLVERLQRETHDRSALAATLQWRGYMSFNTGHYAEAKRDLYAAIEEAVASGNRSALAWSWLSLAQVSLALSDLPTATTYTERADSLLEAQGDLWGRTAAAAVRARIARHTGDLELARAAALRFRTGAEALGGSWRVTALSVLGAVAESEGNAGQAKILLDSALVLAQRDHLLGIQLSLLADLSRVELKLGDPRASLRRLSGLPPFHSSPAYRYSQRISSAAALLALHDPAAAEAEVRSALDSLEAWRAGLDDADLRVVAFSLTDDRPAESDLASVLVGLVDAGRVEAAFEFAERRRARLLLDRLALLADTGAAPGTGQHMDAAALRPDALRRSLPDAHTAMLEFATGDATSPVSAYVVTQTAVAAVVLPPLTAVTDAITRLLSLAEGGSAVASPAEQLGASLLAKVLPLLPDSITRLVIIADRGLHDVPWELLQLPDGRALLDRYVISTSPSASVAARLWQRPRAMQAGGVLAFGAPRFPSLQAGSAQSAPVRAAFLENGGLPGLRYSAAEAKRLRTRAVAGEVRLSGNASEAYLKHADLRSVSVLHLATHALVNDRSAERAALALAPGDGEDGFLTPPELAALRLPVDLVVLSACRTARGPVAGSEGVTGLSTAALQAGARAVLASTWSVSDEASAAFIERFYHQAAAGLDAAAALTEAKRAARDAGLPPRDWAAFKLIGDPFVKLPLHEPPPALALRTKLALAGGLLLLTLALAQGVRRSRRKVDTARVPSSRTASTRH